MNRYDITTTIGIDYLKSNLENGEFSYPKALSKEGKTIDHLLVSSLTNNRKHAYLDLRFVHQNISILIETKDNFDKWNSDSVRQQLQAYVNYEKVLTGNKIIAILANTTDDRLKVWWGSDITIDDSHQIKNQYSLKPFAEYSDLYNAAKNDREQVLKSTYSLNELLHKHGISEAIRSQFVGTCLLALKNELVYENLSTKQIIGGIEEVITQLLSSDLDKAFKLGILKNKVLESQDVRSLSKVGFQEIVRYIQNNILPYINDKSTMGQDILNLFFTTFNKYVGKADKNQAFTPDHIVHFMCQVLGINRNSKVLDPCCGSGAFLVRAMTEAMDDCENREEREQVKKNNIFGIEFEETAFGLATTNMLIHGDGNSNIRQGNCFDMESFIGDNAINFVLMNPPYNAQRKHCKNSYVKNWSNKTNQDPSKGLHYVEHIASLVKTGKLAVLLPTNCSIGNSGDIKLYKEKLLEKHTLDAVFSFPPDVFHPGASASVCCMVFELGIRHEKANKETFFGYFRDDGFIKRKHLGRVEKNKPNSTEGVWSDIESEWLSLYKKRQSIAGKSVNKLVSSQDEWLAEAYMETDYDNLTKSDFSNIVHSHVSFLFSTKLLINPKINPAHKQLINLDTENWKWFKYSEIFDIEKGYYNKKPHSNDSGEIPFIGATEYNNGVTSTHNYEEIESTTKTGVGNNHDISNKIFKRAKYITVSNNGSVGYAFYQPLDFTCSHDVNPITTKEIALTPYIALFLITLISLERYRWTYGRKWRPIRMPKSMIKLPIDKDNKPDWKYMENFIKSLDYSSNLSPLK